MSVDRSNIIIIINNNSVDHSNIDDNNNNNSIDCSNCIIIKYRL